jgi:hypothetical protein
MIPFEHERMAYYVHYGKVMAAWGYVEQALYLIVSVFFPEGMPRHMLGMGFTGIQGFHSKRQFAERAVTRGIANIENGAQLHARWAEILAEVDTVTTKRNHLAHFTTKAFESNQTEGRRIALCPLSAPKKWPKDQPPPGSYCVRELIRTRREFEDVNNQLLNFAFQLLGQPTPIEQSAQPEEDLPTIQQIVDRMHEELGHRRVSARERKREQDARNAAASLEIHASLDATEEDDSVQATGKVLRLRLWLARQRHDSTTGLGVIDALGVLYGVPDALVKALLDSVIHVGSCP